ncbi:type III-A CRISPR-associated RAMP protein Csm5 [Paratractidigestivibacter sp.]|uniref:type III-A CRISPR-associated RAMP protein Csm5 n=1 Tax=Paratractidigestivibacter sp. TaxID=2847316 RepID=UPI002ABDC95C|nr:type III-A CRISPR-associated RAMP protein Csm5 [Paratractidigestivibacter sp.]
MAVRHYRLEFETAGPVHIGNGNRYGKKDYYASGNDIVVLDTRKFTSLLDARQIDRYCEFLGNGRDELQDFLQGNPDMRKLAEKSVAYKVDSPLAQAPGGSGHRHDVWEFVKDPYGNPYVPGSSVKGMLRTAILLNMLLDDRSYRALYDPVIEQSPRSIRRPDASIMKRAFFKERPSKDDPNIANDIMKYVSVADSEPLLTADLVFAKKYDLFSKDDLADHKRDMGRLTRREGNGLDVYRECLRPGTKVLVEITVDDRIDGYLDGITLDAQGISSVLQRAFDFYSESFLSHFNQLEESDSKASPVASDGLCQYVVQSGPLAGRRCRNQAIDGTGYCRTHQEYAGKQSASAEVVCYLGGGVDFMNKTVVSALFGTEDERLHAVSRILYKQFPSRIDRSRHEALWREVEQAGFQPRPFSARFKKNGRLAKAKDDHRHWQDEQLGVAPHTMKYCIVGNKKYPMGKCTLRIKEV